jgi:deoxycytidylate deaminase
MNKSKDLIELTEIIARRSICAVRVGALIYDSHGIISWGWNHMGTTGYGTHAEEHALSRANSSRLKGAKIIVVAIRRGKFICSLPCPNCSARLEAAGIKKIECRGLDKEWITYFMG